MYIHVLRGFFLRRKKKVMPIHIFLKFRQHAIRRDNLPAMYNDKLINSR